ncbi:phage gp6-like head-tail connector protein [Vibrio fortis]|uniref:Phage gp6-like head-tail connector protein n=1 Tax=Vibrio fortis TaxID=212667 RepID=A0A5N3QTE6_9VIBR|nr:head-tail connector protein [Vibrio fortis]KAB0285466.1 phage gp6-like head-tail connector protein [Vibrio fortis]
MAYMVLSRTFSEVVPYAQASKHLRVWDDEDRSYIESLIETAVGVAEKYMNRLVVESTVLVELSQLDHQLPLGRAKSVQEVTYLNYEREERETLPQEFYTFNPLSNRLVLKRAGQAYLKAHNAVEFQATYVTGWAADAIPAEVKHGVLMLVGTLYEMREDATVGQGVTVNTVPVTHQYLFNKHKIHAV